MVRSIATTGWTVDALFTPINKTAPYIDPITLKRLDCLLLQKKKIPKNAQKILLQIFIKQVDFWFCDLFSAPNSGESMVFSVDHNLRLLAQIPKDGAKEDSSNKSECQSDKVVVWTTPICPPLLPKACNYLGEEWLWVCCGKMQVFGARRRHTQLHHQGFISPAK